MLLHEVIALWLKIPNPNPDLNSNTKPGTKSDSINMDVKLEGVGDSVEISCGCKNHMPSQYEHLPKFLIAFTKYDEFVEAQHQHLFDMIDVGNINKQLSYTTRSIEIIYGSNNIDDIAKKNNQYLAKQINGWLLKYL